MRYSKQHKEEARRQLIAASSVQIKKIGFDRASVDSLTAAVGMTSGALYCHFQSKEELLVEVIRHEHRKLLEFSAIMDTKDGCALSSLVDRYLSSEHAMAPETGCPLPAISTDVSRASDEVREIYQDMVVQFRNALSALTGSSDKAWLIAVQCIGAVIIARAFVNDGLREELLVEIRQQIHCLIDRDERR